MTDTESTAKPVKMLTIKDVEQRLGANRWSVWKLINSGALTSIDIGTSSKRKMVRIPESSLEQFIQRRTAEATE